MRIDLHIATQTQTKGANLQPKKTHTVHGLHGFIEAIWWSGATGAVNGILFEVNMSIVVCVGDGVPSCPYFFVGGRGWSSRESAPPPHPPNPLAINGAGSGAEELKSEEAEDRAEGQGGHRPQLVPLRPCRGGDGRAGLSMESCLSMYFCTSNKKNA